MNNFNPESLRRFCLVDSSILLMPESSKPLPTTDLMPVYREVVGQVATLEGVEEVITRVLVGYTESLDHE